MEANAGKIICMCVRISLHFMLDPIQPLEYETGLMKEFVPKEVVRISELFSDCNELLILNILYVQNFSFSLLLIKIKSLSYHHHIFVYPRILERLDVDNISEHLLSQP